MLFISCTEKKIYAPRLVSIVRRKSDLVDAAPAIYSLKHGGFLSPYDSLHLLAKFGSRYDKKMNEQEFGARPGSKLFVEWHCADIFEILTRHREEKFAQVLSWWLNYKGSCYYLRLCRLFLRIILCWWFDGSTPLVFCIRVCEQCVYAIKTFFSYVLMGGPDDAIYVFEGVIALAESVLLLLQPRGVHAYRADAGVFYIL